MREIERTVSGQVIDHVNYSGLTRTETLQLLTKQQEEEMTGLGAFCLQNRGGSEILAVYQGTEYYQITRKELIVHYLTPHTADELSALLDRLTGRIFEDAAFLYLLSSPQNDTVPLDCNKTAVFFSKLYEDTENIPVTHPFGQGSIAGIAVPDNLVIRNGRIITVREFTTFDNYAYFWKKYRALRIEKRKHPGFLAESHLEFFVPRTTSVVNKSQMFADEPDKTFSVTFTQIPIRHADISRFVVKMLDNTDDPFAADFSDLQAYARRMPPSDHDSRWDARHLAYKQYVARGIS